MITTLLELLGMIAIAVGTFLLFGLGAALIVAGTLSVLTALLMEA